jgi:hypothetical protein
LRVRLKASEFIGAWYFQVYVNSSLAGLVFCPDNEYSEWTRLILPSGPDDYNIVAVFVGSESTIDQRHVVRYYEVGGGYVKAEWAWEYETLGTADIATLTGWSVAGLAVGNTQPGSRTTRRSLPVSLAVSGGTATITLGNLASGSGAVGSTVTLTALSGSVVSGSVAVAAGAVTATGSLVIRYPEYMDILRGPTDPPSASVGTVYYDLNPTAEYIDNPDAGTYYYALRATSDTDDTGDTQTAQAVTVTGLPDAPSDIAYDSGNAAATVITWTASATVGATYNIYVQSIGDEYLDTVTPAATAIAGATSATLPAQTGAPGSITIVVRAELGGVEEKNLNTLTVEYDALGAVVADRPNTPTVDSIDVSSGLTASVIVSYNGKDEAATPATVNLYTRTLTGSYNFGSVDASASIVAGITGTSSATVSYTFPASGWYYVTAKAATAGGVESASSATETAVYVSDTNISAPTGTFTATR